MFSFGGKNLLLCFATKPHGSKPGITPQKSSFVCKKSCLFGSEKNQKKVAKNGQSSGAPEGP